MVGGVAERRQFGPEKKFMRSIAAPAGQEEGVPRKGCNLKDQLGPTGPTDFEISIDHRQTDVVIDRAGQRIPQDQRHLSTAST